MPKVKSQTSKGNQFRPHWHLNLLSLGVAALCGPLLPSVAQAALPQGYVELQNIRSGKCVDSGGGDAVQNYCNGANAQRLVFLPAETGYYAIQPKGSGQCLEARGNYDGAPIQKAACDPFNVPGQKWALRESSAVDAAGVLRTRYQFVSANSSKCMVIQNASLDAGMKVFSYQCNQGDNEYYYANLVEARVSDVGGTYGVWSQPIPLTIVASGATNLPNGKILYWSGSGPDSFHGMDANGYSKTTHTEIFNPATNAAENYLAVNTGHEMFCPGTTLLGDGRLLISGGGGSFFDRNHVTSYNSVTGLWARESNLNLARWYATTAIMGDGSVFTLGGDPDDGSKIWEMVKGEVYSANTASPSWKLLTTMQKDFWSVRPNSIEIGTLDNAGLQKWNYYQRVFPGAKGMLEVAPSPQMMWHDTTGTGTTTTASTRTGDMQRQGSVTVPYSASKLLLTGGSASFGDEDPKNQSANYPAFSSSYAVDLTTGTAQSLAAMKYSRYMANGVVLPDGKVFVVGGSATSQLFSTAAAVMAPEMYDPASNTWTVLSAMSKPRIYHSTALLMPDGRVWVAGGGQCGSLCGINQLSAEIYSPPYLYKGGRPTIDTALPQSVNFGADLTLNATAPFGKTIKEFTLIRMASVTHATNTDQRISKVVPTSSSGTSYQLKMPNGNYATPPGYYMLFAMTNDGVPSVAKIIRLM